MNIAIYYGNLNPITINDVGIITSIFNTLDIDKIWVIVDSKIGSLSVEQKIKICNNELKHIKNVRVDQSFGFSLSEYIEYYKNTFVDDEFYIVSSPHAFNNYDSELLKNNKFIVSNGLIYDDRKEIAKSVSMVYNHNILINERTIIEYIEQGKNPEPFISHKSHMYLKRIIHENKKEK